LAGKVAVRDIAVNAFIANPLFQQIARKSTGSGGIYQEVFTEQRAEREESFSWAARWMLNTSAIF
jgi:stalled ribosome alternative rescue factor ArfA